MPGSQGELAADELELGGLGLLEAGLRARPDRARVDHRGPEHESVEVVADVVVVGDGGAVAVRGLWSAPWRRTSSGGGGGARSTPSPVARRSRATATGSTGARRGRGSPPARDRRTGRRRCRRRRRRRPGRCRARPGRDRNRARPSGMHVMAPSRRPVRPSSRRTAPTATGALPRAPGRGVQPAPCGPPFAVARDCSAIRQLFATVFVATGPAASMGRASRRRHRPVRSPSRRVPRPARPRAAAVPRGARRGVRGRGRHGGRPPGASRPYRTVAVAVVPEQEAVVAAELAGDRRALERRARCWWSTARCSTPSPASRSTAGRSPSVPGGGSPGVDGLDPAARTVVVLEDCNDHENLGAIARSARALGADAMVLSPRCADPLYRRSVRVSMGEILRLPVVVATRVARRARRAAGRRLHGAGPDPGRRRGRPRRWSSAPTTRVAVLLGAEGPGLTARAQQAATCACASRSWRASTR